LGKCGPTGLSWENKGGRWLFMTNEIIPGVSAADNVLITTWKSA
jgi:hypothetical protein